MSPASSLRLEHLTVGIHSTRNITETEKALRSMMVNGGKLRILAPLGQNHVEQLKGGSVSVGSVSREKLVSLNAGILRLAERATTAPKPREKLLAVFRRPSLSAKPVVSHAGALAA